MADAASPFKVLLADAHAPARAGLRLALDTEHFDVVAEVDDSASAIAAAMRVLPDICVLDADMPGDPIEATAIITRQLPRAAVVVLSSRKGEGPMLAAVLAGAVGYLHKDMDPERLRFALRGVMAGEAALPRRLVARLMDELRARDRVHTLPSALGLDVQLTGREWAVLELLAEGVSTRDAAGALGIADVTVRRHLSAAVGKLGVADRAAAIATVLAARAR